MECNRAARGNPARSARPAPVQRRTQLEIWWFRPRPTCSGAGHPTRHKLEKYLDAYLAAFLRFIEVKGRTRGAAAVTVTKNEILTCLNKPDEYLLAICPSSGETVEIRHLRKPFLREPDFGATSVNYDLAGLLVQGKEPT